MQRLIWILALVLIACAPVSKTVTNVSRMVQGVQVVS